jgi:2-methylcitrate dehydratase PrpD
MAEVMDDIVRFITRTNYSDLPRETVGYAKKICLSQLAGLVGGAKMPVSKIVARHVQRQGGAAEAGVAGYHFKAPADQAALFNATATHATELEDGAFPNKTTIGTIVPTVFTLGDALKSTGPEVLESIILGFDVHAKTQMTSKAGVRGHQVFSTGVWGPAASAAKLMKLSDEQTKMTMCIAASQFGGMLRQTASMTHFLESGFAARDAILIAQLARDGCTGHPDVLEAPTGLWDLVGGEREGLKQLSELLAGELHFMRLGIKKYGAPYMTQRLIDGAIDLRREENIKFEDIDCVEVHVAPWFTKIIRIVEPRTAEDSRFSVHHFVASAMLGDPVSLHTFTEGIVRDPKYVEARKKIVVHVHEDRGHDHSFMFDTTDDLVVKMKNGTEYRKVCQRAKGAPPLYLSDEEVMQKFRSAAEFGGYLSADAIARVGQMVLNLEQVQDVSEIMAILT